MIMKQISHTINRDGKIVPANGFKQPEPTISMNKPNLWMHSVERKDFSNPLTGFLILGVTLIVMGLMIKYLVS